MITASPIVSIVPFQATLGTFGALTADEIDGHSAKDSRAHFAVQECHYQLRRLSLLGLKSAMATPSWRSDSAAASNLSRVLGPKP